MPRFFFAGRMDAVPGRGMILADAAANAPTHCRAR